MRIHRSLTQLLSLLLVVLGVVMVAVTLANGGGQVGVILGLLFVAAGGARLYVQRAR